MKKIIKTLLSLSAILVLAGCSKGTKVKEASFDEACAKLEEHQYNKMTISYEIDIKFTDSGNEQTTSLKESNDYEYRYAYIEELDEWKWCWCRVIPLPEDEEINDYESEGLHLCYTVKDERPTVAHTASYDDVKVSSTYYTNPLKIVAKVKGTASGTNYTRTVNNVYTHEFGDKYGYMTKYTQTIDETYKGKTAVGGTYIYRDQAWKGTKRYTITYSD